MANAKVFTVENRKGGVSKTTTAVTVAAGLAERIRTNGGRVLLVDLDAQGDASRALGIEPNGRCISYVLTGEGTIKDNIKGADRQLTGGPHRPNLFILPASDRLRTAKEELLAGIASSVAARIATRTYDPKKSDDITTVLNNRLEVARQLFDYIIVDCPPTLDILQEAVHEFADYAIVPVKMDFLGTSATGRHTGNILADQDKGIDIKIFAVLPTFVDARLTLTKAMMEQLTKKYGRLVCKPVPPTIKVAEATAEGKTIMEYLPDSAAAEAYRYLIDRVLSA